MVVDLDLGTRGLPRLGGIRRAFARQSLLTGCARRYGSLLLQGEEIHVQMYFLYYVFVQLYKCMVELTEYTIQVYNNYAHHARMKRTIQC